MFDAWQLAFLMLSLVIHFFVIFPFLLLWANTKPFVQDEPPPARVTMRAPRSHQAPSAARQSSSAPANRARRHSKTQAPNLVHRTPSKSVKRPVPRLPQAPTVPISHIPQPPSTDYPTAQSGQNGRSNRGPQGEQVQPGMPGQSQVPDPNPNQNPNSNPAGNQQPGPPGPPHEDKVEGASAPDIPDSPLPDIFQRREMSATDMVLECRIDAEGHATVKVVKASGRGDDFDKFVALQYESQAWKPMLHNGKPEPTLQYVRLACEALKPGFGQRMMSIHKV